MSEQPDNQESKTMAYVMVGLVFACWVALLLTGVSTVGLIVLGLATLLVGFLLYQRFRS